MDSRVWINDIREIKKHNDEILTLRNGHWQVKDKISILLKYAPFFYDSHLDSIKTVSYKVLSEIHPMFDLKPEDRFAAVIHGKIPKYSSELRKGICETLAFLGIHGSELKNCTLQKPEITATLILRELFKDSDWKLWASLNDLLPILAEAVPNEFLSSVDNALKQSPCPFDELFSQEGGSGITGANYMTGLYWALETLAWSEEHLSRVILTLAELATHDLGGRYANRPANSITTILIPWLPQTTASFERRIAALKGIQRNFPDIAWKTLIKLLPNQHQVSMGSHKPSFRKFIPKDWKKGVSIAEYREQIQEYAAIAIDMAKGNIRYISVLVENLDNIPNPSFNAFLEYLSSDAIIEKSDEEKQPIWETMIAFVRKHRRFSDSKWALPTEMVDLLEQTTEKLRPLNPEFLHRHLFSNKDYDYMDTDVDWKTQQDRMLERRVEALKQIYKINRIDSVLLFARNVDKPIQVGNTFAYIADEENDSELLPSLFDDTEQYKKQFVSGYIWGRYYINGIKWINNLNIQKWSIDNKCNLLLLLPFENEVWEKAEEILGSYVGDYWKRINANPFPTQSSLFRAIENLLKFGRPRLAINCIYAHYFSKKEFFKERAIKALIDGTSSDESVGALDPHQVIEIIKLLQDDPEVNEDDLFKIEWAYVPLLDEFSSVKPKILEKRLSREPDFFIEAIQLIYRSKNDEQEKNFNLNTSNRVLNSWRLLYGIFIKMISIIYRSKNIDKANEVEEKKSNIMLNAWSLLNNWKRTPGKMDDGSFSGEALREWVEEVKRKTIESGHFEVAMIRLGHVLFHAGPDQNGLWIQQSVAEILNENDNDDMRQGFRLEIYNSRGVHFIDTSGNDEKELANLWRKNADAVEKIGLVRFASSLKELANSYEREAERVISDYAGNDSIEKKAKNE